MRFTIYLHYFLVNLVKIVDIGGVLKYNITIVIRAKLSKGSDAKL